MPPIFLIYIKNITNFLWNLLNENFISSLVGGFLSTFFFWIVFQRKIESLFTFNEKKRLSKRFMEEMIYNFIVANNIIKKESEYLNGDTFTFLEYEVNDIDTFVKLAPLDLSKKFYLRARVMNSALKKDNKLINIYWFTPNLTRSDRLNHKNIFINNAKINIETIKSFLSDPDFISQAKSMGIDDSSFDAIQK